MRVLRRAGLIHDLGRLGVANTVWDKPGPLTNTVQQAIDVWSTHGKLQVKVTPSDLIDFTYVNQ